MQSEKTTPDKSVFPVEQNIGQVRRQRIYIAVGVVVVVLAGLALYGINYYKTQEAHKQEQITTAREQRVSAEAQPYGSENGGEAGHFALMANYSLQAGDYKDALGLFKKAQASAELQKIPANQLTYLPSIADTYSKLGDKANAKSYFQKAIDALKKVDATGSADYIKQLEKLRDSL